MEIQNKAIFFNIAYIFSSILFHYCSKYSNGFHCFSKNSKKNSFDWHITFNIWNYNPVSASTEFVTRGLSSKTRLYKFQVVIGEIKISYSQYSIICDIL